LPCLIDYLFFDTFHREPYWRQLAAESEKTKRHLVIFEEHVWKKAKEAFDRVDGGWSATPLHWIIQYWTPVEWTPVGLEVEWSEASPTPVLQWSPSAIPRRLSDWSAKCQAGL